MKKYIYLFLTLITPPILSNAQIKVDNYGRMGIGSFIEPSARFTLGVDGMDNGLVFYEQAKGGSSLRLFRNNNYGYIVRGRNTSQGITMDQYGGVSFKFSDTYQYSNLTAAFLNHENQRAWCVYRNNIRYFYVAGNGDVWHNGLHTISDERFKDNIADLDYNETKSNLHKLRSVSYFKKENANFSTLEIDTIEVNKQKSKKGKEYGFLAQEVEKIYPELVTTNESGIKAINYLGFIPIVVKSLQEQENEIETLRTEVSKLKHNNKLKSGKTTETIPSTAASSIDMDAYIEQNTPNPFSKETTISMFIPENILNSELYIYKLDGTQIDEITISETGNTSIAIEGNTFSPGMYLYSLICDGKLIATKQMIITQ